MAKNKGTAKDANPTVSICMKRCADSAESVNCVKQLVKLTCLNTTNAAKGYRSWAMKEIRLPERVC